MRDAAQAQRVIVAQDYEESAALVLSGAKREAYVYTDVRTSPPEEIPVYVGNPERLQREWFGIGENHRVEDGRAKRELTHFAWVVTVNTLDELHDLAQRTGRDLSVVSSPERLWELDE